MTSPLIPPHPPRPALHLLFCAALPPSLAARLRDWTAARLSPEDTAHGERFTDPQAARARLLARALLLLACRHACPALPATLVAMPSGAPAFRRLSPEMSPAGLPPEGMEAAVSFAYSPHAVACGLALGPAGLRLGVDLEAVASPPPAPRAFHSDERDATPCEALRRWTVKEALLKAWGTGLTLDPARVSTGRRGQRRGVSAPFPALPPLFWNSLPLPGHWCSFALSHSLPLRLSCLTPATVAAALREPRQSS